MPLRLAKVQVFNLSAAIRRTDEQEFYQLLTYKDDLDLGIKLTEWESFLQTLKTSRRFRGKSPLRNPA